MKSNAAQAIALATVLALPTVADAQNLIRNGSFEDVSYQAGVQQQPSGTWAVYASIPGWTTVQGPGLEVRNNDAGTAQHGVDFVELDSHYASDTNSWIQQVVYGTTAGAAYTLSFWYSPRIGQTAATNPIEALWNGNVVTVPAITGAGGTTHDWQQYTYTVVSTGWDVLSFRAAGIDDSYGGSLDNVALTPAVPEPGSLALMLGGIAAVGWVARRRRT